MFTLRATQDVSASVSVTDRKGNPTTLQNPTWSSTDPAILTVTTGADGLSATISAVGPVGVATVSLEADADLGDGVEPISATEDIEVVAGNAAVINLAFAPPVEQGTVVDPGPVDPGPVDPGPVDPGPVDPGPVEPTDPSDPIAGGGTSSGGGI